MHASKTLTRQSSITARILLSILAIGAILFGQFAVNPTQASASCQDQCEPRIIQIYTDSVEVYVPARTRVVIGMQIERANDPGMIHYYSVTLQNSETIPMRMFAEAEDGSRITTSIYNPVSIESWVRIGQ